MELVQNRKPNISHDGAVNIAIGMSRKETRWKNREMQWSELVERLSSTVRTAESYADYIKAKKNIQDEIKDVGGYVGGYVSGGRRKTENVVNRQLLTLDVDHGMDLAIWDDFVLLYGCAGVLYTTHKHAPGSPRFRLVVPLDRPVFCDEYQAIARRLAGDLGINAFDDTTFEPARLMYWPSTSKDGEFLFEVNDGKWLSAEEMLGRYVDWQDCTSWPESDRSAGIIKREMKKQGDPLEKPGLIGAFCRQYSIDQAIQNYLSDIYESCGDDRYTYKEGSTAAGLVTYEDKFAFSHHGTDPISGKLCNAFDLCRLHLFGLRDEDAKEGTAPNRLPSYTAMVDFVGELPDIKKTLAEEKFKSAQDDFEEEIDLSWTEGLEVDKRGVTQNTLSNLILILENDPKLKGIVFNALADGMEIKGDVPWKHPARYWRDADDAQLISYIDAHYGNFTARYYDIAVTKVVDDRAYHPIREYIQSLPSWDGVARVDTLLIDYLGAEDNDYTKAVTRKMLCAAVKRVLEPGCKFDYMTVLSGPQGIGKSTLIAKLAMSWFSDSLSLADTKDKTAAEKLQGYWVLEIGELAGLKKAETENLKSFISRQNDIYRASFGRRATPHLRQCVFVGTTNEDAGYLRGTQGNRRIWPVHTPGGSSSKPWDLTSDLVDQIWAETLQFIEKKEPLYLNPELEEIAREKQREALESDEREGLVNAYLETPLPENWESMDLDARRNYFNYREFEKEEFVGIERKEVTRMEIWCECFGKREADFEKKDSHAISAILSKLNGWESTNLKKRIPIYGQQRLYLKK